MFLLLLRRLLELVLFSVVPGCIASIIIWQDSIQGTSWFYPVLLTVILICTFIFFAGNMLMMRRMVRDISSKEKYHFVQWTSFAIYAILLILVCMFYKEHPVWKDLRDPIFFHARVFYAITMPLEDTAAAAALITSTQSMLISTTIFGIITAISYKWFNTLYEKEVATRFEQNEAERIATMEIRRAYQARQDKIEKAIRKGKAVPQDFDNMEELEFTRRRFGSKQATNSSEKLKYRLKAAVFEAGSYAFYQRYIEKQENGEDARTYAKNYLKNKVSLGFSLRQTRKMK